jgi:tetratricopeptide (TPR) repeat protein
LRVGGWRAAAIALALAAAAPAQDPAIDRARRALDAGDSASARVALLELLAVETPGRADAVAKSLDVFRDRGATDDWLEAAERWSRAHPDDALVAFYRGITWQDLKHLRRAEAALARARELAPNEPSVQEAWAWNAKLRFDAAGFLERSQGASFRGVEDLRREESARLAARPVSALVLAGLLGAGLLGATVFLLWRR